MKYNYGDFEDFEEAKDYYNSVADYDDPYDVRGYYNEMCDE